MAYPRFGDLVDGSCDMCVCTNVSVCPVDKLPSFVLTPPPVSRAAFMSKIHEPFNDIRYAVSTNGDPSTDEPEDPYRLYVPRGELPAQNHSPFRARVIGYLIPREDLDVCALGTAVMDPNFPCPTLNESNNNVFRRLFGVMFKRPVPRSPSYIRPVSTYEFARCYSCDETLSQQLA